MLRFARRNLRSFLGGAADWNFQRKPLSNHALDWRPVEAAIGALDAVQGATQLPWWFLFPLTAVTLRTVLFPLTLKQIQSTGTTVASFAQAVQRRRSEKPPGDSWSLDDIQSIWRRSRELRRGCPHASWTVLAPLVQIPSFLLCVVAVRRMCQMEWPGLAVGGTLWFPDLTQSAVSFAEGTVHLGLAGAILPVAITLSYLTHVHHTFRKGRLGAAAVPSVGLSTFLRVGLEWLSVPILVVTLQLPQGALLYWLASSLWSVGQSVLLGLPTVRQSLRLPPLEPTSASTTALSPQIRRLFRQAAELRAKGALDASIVALEEISSLEPENARGHFALAQVLANRRQWSAAISHYRASLRHETDSRLRPQSYLHLGVAQFMVGDFKASEASLLASHKLRKPDVAAWMALCSLYKRMGDRSRAKAALQRAIELDPNCRQWERHL